MADINKDVELEISQRILSYLRKIEYLEAIAQDCRKLMEINQNPLHPNANRRVIGIQLLDNHDPFDKRAYFVRDYKEDWFLKQKHYSTAQLEKEYRVFSLAKLGG